MMVILSSFILITDGVTEEDKEEFARKFEWWPTDAKPAPVQDPDRGGYWWWPEVPGEIRPWGNRGYIYVNKIIFDYKAEEEEEPKEEPITKRKEDPRPSLLIKKILKNVKIYFDFDRADLRDDAISILENAVRTLNKNPEADILITGNCDRRGPEAYNLKLGKLRGESVRQFMINKGISDSRIRIISRGKLDAVAPINDIVGMQKDRNAQFMIAEVVEVMIPYSERMRYPEGSVLEEGQEIESAVKVSTKEYIIRKNDTLWKIAAREYGDGNQWRRIYNINRDRIKDPNKLKTGQRIIIPVE
ncbi:MAG: OmpA family protein [Candidatus Omnitrophica bacterium]|nr:OmpA family protein [Candidatus Omnitrophota bacterium]